ncbi:hypothetical protein [Fluoribacter gormanii]|uniref:hypothetical protein n=1 Tax=Fluoribacter gormanii TaxID=464 RepID=UPI00104117FC|nr:hypothetical protein [Fluoribacter gormanii]
MQDKREGGLFAAVAEGFSVLSEKNAIKTFCSNSETFKTMQKDSFSGDSKRKQELIQAIKGANTFSDMLPLIDKFNPGMEKESMATKVLFKTVVFFGSYVNTDADFVYHLPTLKNEIINYAVEHGYELNYRKDSSHGM